MTGSISSEYCRAPRSTRPTNSSSLHRRSAHRHGNRWGTEATAVPGGRRRTSSCKNAYIT